ncbi:radical SAM protein [PVC group bacterium]|nr:radical SAM protein [PVC group bacterium]
MRSFHSLRGYLKKKDVFNRAGLRFSQLVRGRHAFGQPKIIQIETTASCNLKCVMCPHGKDGVFSDGRKAFMTHQEFANVLDKFPKATSVSLQGVGEPMLNPDLPRIVSEAVRRGMETGFYTNGTLLSSGNCEWILRSGLNWIIVSLDAGTPEEFKRIRKGADLNKIMSNLKGLIKAKKELKARNPSVGIMFVAMPSNVNEISSVIDIAVEAGVDWLSIKGCHGGLSSNEKEWAVSEEDFKKLQAAIKTEKAKALTIHMDSREVDPRIRGPKKSRMKCTWAWEKTYISVDGSACPCCYALPELGMSVGNIFTDDFKNIWNNAKYTQFREKIKNEVADVCEKCPLY